MKQWAKNWFWLPVIAACAWYVSIRMPLPSQILYILTVTVFSFGLITISNVIIKNPKRYHPKWVRSTLVFFLLLFSVLVANDQVFHSSQLIIIPVIIFMGCLIDMIFPAKPKDEGTD